MAVEVPDERHPLVITGGLDGAVVLVLATQLKRDHSALQWLWIAASMLSSLFLPVLLSGAALLFGLVWRVWSAAPCDTQVLRLHVDRTGVFHRGRKVNLWFDFQHLTVDDAGYVIEGGLSLKEHQRLKDLVRPRLEGDADEVPEALGHLTQAE